MSIIIDIPIKLYITLNFDFVTKHFNKMSIQSTDRSISDQNYKQFLCNLCHNLLNDPKESLCCRQTYCRVCINRWLDSNNSCPNDGKPFTENDLIKPSKAFINLLNDLLIVCDYSSDGCSQEVKLSEKSAHLAVCRFNPNRLCIDCELPIDSNETHNCVKGLKIKNIKLYEENENFKQDFNVFKAENNQTINVSIY